jgi:hypothetical protein
MGPVCLKIERLRMPLNIRHTRGNTNAISSKYVSRKKRVVNSTKKMKIEYFMGYSDRSLLGQMGMVERKLKVDHENLSHSYFMMPLTCFRFVQSQ